MPTLDIAYLRADANYTDYVSRNSGWSVEIYTKLEGGSEVGFQFDENDGVLAEVRTGGTITADGKPRYTEYATHIDTNAPDSWGFVVPNVSRSGYTVTFIPKVRVEFNWVYNGSAVRSMWHWDNVTDISTLGQLLPGQSVLIKGTSTNDTFWDNRALTGNRKHMYILERVDTQNRVGYIKFYFYDNGYNFSFTNMIDIPTATTGDWVLTQCRDAGSGYNFLYWMHDNVAVTSGVWQVTQGQTQNVSFVAYGTYKNITITWDGNDMVPDMTTVGHFDDVVDLPQPTLNGYNLIGWKTDRLSVATLTGSRISIGITNKTYYAYFRERTYNVKVYNDLDGLGRSGTVYKTAQYTYNSSYTLFEGGVKPSGEIVIYYKIFASNNGTIMRNVPTIWSFYSDNDDIEMLYVWGYSEERDLTIYNSVFNDSNVNSRGSLLSTTISAIPNIYIVLPIYRKFGYPFNNWISYNPSKYDDIDGSVIMSYSYNFNTEYTANYLENGILSSSKLANTFGMNANNSDNIIKLSDYSNILGIAYGTQISFNQLKGYGINQSLIKFGYYNLDDSEWIIIDMKSQINVNKLIINCFHVSYCLKKFTLYASNDVNDFSLGKSSMKWTKILNYTFTSIPSSNNNTYYFENSQYQYWAILIKETFITDSPYKICIQKINFQLNSGTLYPDFDVIKDNIKISNIHAILDSEKKEALIGAGWNTTNQRVASTNLRNYKIFGAGDQYYRASNTLGQRITSGTNIDIGSFAPDGNVVLYLSNGSNTVTVNGYNITIPNGYQYFTIPRNGKYNIFLAGASTCPQEVRNRTMDKTLVYVGFEPFNPSRYFTPNSGNSALTDWYIRGSGTMHVSTTRPLYTESSSNDPVYDKLHALTGTTLLQSYEFTAGDVIVMCVGKCPRSQHGFTSAGGGGTFISKLKGTSADFNRMANHVIIAVAGGGGGTGYITERYKVTEAWANSIPTSRIGLTASRNPAPDRGIAPSPANNGGGGGGAGGSGGGYVDTGGNWIYNGSTGGGGNGSGAGGGGFIGNGGNAPSINGGQSFLNGGEGGYNGAMAAPYDNTTGGGFGGGGASWNAGGGGGGFCGGSAAPSNARHGAGKGSSYFANYNLDDIDFWNNVRPVITRFSLTTPTIKSLPCIFSNRYFEQNTAQNIKRKFNNNCFCLEHNYSTGSGGMQKYCWENWGDGWIIFQQEYDDKYGGLNVFDSLNSSQWIVGNSSYIGNLIHGKRNITSTSSGSWFRSYNPGFLQLSEQMDRSYVISDDNTFVFNFLGTQYNGTNIYMNTNNLISFGSAMNANKSRNFSTWDSGVPAIGFNHIFSIMFTQYISSIITPTDGTNIISLVLKLCTYDEYNSYFSTTPVDGKYYNKPENNVEPMECEIRLIRDSSYQYIEVTLETSTNVKGNWIAQDSSKNVYKLFNVELGEMPIERYQNIVLRSDLSGNNWECYQNYYVNI